MEFTRVRITVPDGIDPFSLSGVNDQFLRQIDAAFDVVITFRGNMISIAGLQSEVNRARAVIAELIKDLEAGKTLNGSLIKVLIDKHVVTNDTQEHSFDTIVLNYKGQVVVPKTHGQNRYVEAINSHIITFCTGPAGSGKTYLAMAMAFRALKTQAAARIVLTRPVVEAGETLGFLPGTLQEKLDPYVRPLYDALFDLAGADEASLLIEKGIVEIAPLAFMRGRTFNDAFVILDEAQNTTAEQMKMFLTRLGLGSTFVITGDETQRDLRGKSGIESARSVLTELNEVAFVELAQKDIVRHSLVARIVDAYEQNERSGSALA